MKNLIFCFFALIASSQINAQIFEDFTFAPEWTTSGSTNPESSWYWSPVGTAESHNWNDRPPIESPSGGGALVFNGDSLSTISEGLESIFVITSPFYDNPGYDKAGLTFFNYFKNYEGKAYVELTTNEGVSQRYPVNRNVGNFMETSNLDFIFVDVSDFLTPATPVFQISFIFEGVGAFWIVDDLQIVEDVSVFTPTFPPDLADTLCLYDYPFHTDTAGGAYIPDEVVVEYAAGTTEAMRQMARDNFQITDWEVCNCSDLELWKSPIVLQPMKVDLVNPDFSEGDIPLLPSEGLNQDSGCGTNRWTLAESMSDVCNEYPDFDQHTPDMPGSRMIVVQSGPDAGFTLPSLVLQADSAYVLSFYARSVADFGIPEVDIRVGGVLAQSLAIDNTFGWGRYDILISPGAGGTIELDQTNEIGVWALDDLCLAQYILGQNTVIGVNGVIETAKACIEINETDKNYINTDRQQTFTDSIPPAINPSLPNLTQTTTEKVIAVLDTGIDYNKIDNNLGIDIPSHLYFNTTNTCYNDDFIGYDFIEKDGFPYDNSKGGHGTHVAGIILKTLAENDDIEPLCEYKIMPVRTHDRQGLSTLFNVACGITYATVRGANYINASWGYYGEEKDILENVIMWAGDTTDVLLVCSAGNDGENIENKKHWPSSLDLENMITVAATDNSGVLASFSNRDDRLVHFGTYGVNVRSCIPDHLFFQSSFKDGTSMAAPRLLAAAVLNECECFDSDRVDLRPLLNKIADLNNIIVNDVRAGRYIDTQNFTSQLVDADCIKVSAPRPPEVLLSLEIFPNPVEDYLTLKSKVFLPQNTPYRVVNLTGINLQNGFLFGEENTINLNTLSQGLYYLQVIYQGQVYTQTFVKTIN